ncbi:hypothetical protein AXF42_Ash018596 [Apostasia shenzhenica]|uniref:Phosphatidyl-N-methylethanolamine N-methyltransferase n=1 Tax=Apostasia shenzhenica TaxID=1088818 RepID=A0A2I0APY7_9ASPA|nr:hypothetical protein AXF42_Ash018596 [Apostasia shenzhenica]
MPSFLTATSTPQSARRSPFLERESFGRTEKVYAIERTEREREEREGGERRVRKWVRRAHSIFKVGWVRTAPHHGKRRQEFSLRSSLLCAQILFLRIKKRPTRSTGLQRTNPTGGTAMEQMRSAYAPISPEAKRKNLLIDGREKADTPESLQSTQHRNEAVTVRNRGSGPLLFEQVRAAKSANGNSGKHKINREIEEDGRRPPTSSEHSNNIISLGGETIKELERSRRIAACGRERQKPAKQGEQEQRQRAFVAFAGQRKELIDKFWGDGWDRTEPATESAPRLGNHRLFGQGSMAAAAATAAVVLGTMAPFPFYYFLWSYPQAWVNLCGKGVDPCHRMAQISHALKLVQFASILLVARFSWPPWYYIVLLSLGQYLNFKVYQLLGEAGTYYGVRFGKNIPWVMEFPFGYIKDPQYVGSILSLVACSCWVPLKYLLLWILGYMFMMRVESMEDPATRAKPFS